MGIDILVWLGEHRTPFFDRVFTWVTNAGGEIFSVAVVCLIFWCINKRLGNRLLLTLFPGILIGQILKIVFRVPRPWVRSARVKPLEIALPEATGYSFPSVHTANSVCTYGAVAQEKKRSFLLFWLIPLIVGFSRLYTGVHTPQDVFFSMVYSTAFVFLSEKLLNLLEARPKLDKVVCAVSVALSVLTAVFAALLSTDGDAASPSMRTDTVKLCGAAIGAFAGWYLERKTVGFSIPGGLLKRLARFAGGMALVICLMKGLKTPFTLAMGASAGGFLRYLIIGITATFFWPWIFTKAGF